MITGCDPTPETITRMRRNTRICAALYLLLGIAGVGLGALAVVLRGRASWEDDVLLVSGVMWLVMSLFYFKRSKA